MARNHHHHANKRSRTQGRGQLMLLVMSFVTGYMSSSIVNINQLSAWLDKSYQQVASSHPKIKELAPAPKMVATNQPKLEFYTVLTKETDHRIPPAVDLKKMVKPDETLLAKNNDDKPLEMAKVLEAKPVKEEKIAKVDPNQLPKIASGELKKGSYVVQLASFRYYSQAEKFKAKLILKGFDVKISSIERGPMRWYRVMLGPYSSIVEAQKANIIFQAREHASGMVRQMEA
jgi:cell division protein FtsN